MLRLESCGSGRVRFEGHLGCSIYLPHAPGINSIFHAVWLRTHKKSSSAILHLRHPGFQPGYKNTLNNLLACSQNLE